MPCTRWVTNDLAAATAADAKECFVTVYGDVPSDGSRRNLGVCGVCRQPMRLTEGGGRRTRGNNSEFRPEINPATINVQNWHC